ncbi:M20 family metallopeptidase [Ruminococcaceae bacterium OttesenSCG-928-I18]|nr:M20 family metallopeptidase [Ruminococcaceae bacterium OttesenSCG-928-I18]
MSNRIGEYVERFPIAELLGDLIRMDTQNPPGNEGEAVEYIKQFFEKRAANGQKVAMEVLDHGQGRASLIVKLPGEKKEGLAFVGHLDTVPAEEIDKWKYPPLEAVVEDGKMYGRGGSDMKGGDASMMIAAGYFLDNPVPLPRDLYFIFTADEETGSKGIRAVRQTGVFHKVSEVLVGEPTDNRIGIFEKGAIGIDFTASGKAAHAALPEEGINAIERLGEFIDRLKEACRTERKSRFGDRMSIAVTMTQGGCKNNIIPRQCHSHIDVRTVHPQEHVEIIEHIERLAEEMAQGCGVQIEYRLNQNRLPIQVEEDAKIIRGLQEVYGQMGLEHEFTHVPYYTDMEEIAIEHPLPFAILGPGARDIAHQTNEYILLENVAKVAEIYIRYAAKTTEM